MGFFSWKTCDTQQSIPAAAAGFPMKPVYLLQPNGKAPIKESCYEGYGEFGGVDAYEWLARENAQALNLNLADKSTDDIRIMGVYLENGDILRDVETGQIWHVFFDARDLIDGMYFAGSFAQPIPEFGMSANDLVASGRLIKESITDLIGLPYPLKFSFNPDAVYEDLPASEICPNQGFFYDEDEDEDE